MDTYVLLFTLYHPPRCRSYSPKRWVCELPELQVRVYPTTRFRNISNSSQCLLDRPEYFPFPAETTATTTTHDGSVNRISLGIIPAHQVILSAGIRDLNSCPATIMGCRLNHTWFPATPQMDLQTNLHGEAEQSHRRRMYSPNTIHEVVSKIGILVNFLDLFKVLANQGEHR